MVVKCLDAESQYAANKDLKREDIQNLKEWLKLQPHLPPVSEFELQLFLHSCYYSNEATKLTIDNFYTMRTHSPELFGNRDPKRADFQTTLKSFLTWPMDRLTPEGYGVVYTRLIDFNPDIYKFDQQVNLFDMRVSLWLKEVGCVQGHVIVMDFTGGAFAHLTKVSLSSLKKILYFMQEAIPLRLKAIHFINPVTFMDKLMSLMKPFMKKELVDLLHIHTNIETVFKTVPLYCLPKECGGTAPSFKDLHKANIKYLHENVDVLKADNFFVDETLRPGKPKTSGDLFGVEGTFKKLDID